MESAPPVDTPPRPQKDDTMTSSDANPYGPPQDADGWSSPNALPQGGGAPSNPYASTQGGDAPSNPYASTQGGGAPSNPYASPQGRGAPSNPYATPDASGPRRGAGHPPGPGEGRGRFDSYASGPGTWDPNHPAHAPRAEKWSPVWALILGGLATLAGLGGVGIGLYLIVSSLMSGHEYAGLGVMVGIFAMFLALPTAALGTSYLLTRRRALFVSAITAAAFSLLVLLSARSW